MIFKKKRADEAEPQTFNSTELINYLLYLKEEADTYATMTDIQALYQALRDARERYVSHFQWLINAQYLERLCGLVGYYDALLRADELKKITRKQLREPIAEFIAYLENNGSSGTILADLRDAQVMKLIHQQSVFVGEIDGELQKTVNRSYWHCVLAALGVLFYLIVIGFFPYAGLMIAAKTIFAGSCAFFSAFLNAGVESFFSAQTSLPSMILGNQYTQLSVMQSNDKRSQMAAWMAIKASSRAYISSIVFMIAALVLSILLPLNPWPLVLMMSFSLVLQFSIELILPFYRFKNTQLADYLNDYQKKGVRHMQLSDNEKKAWLSNIKRKELSMKAFYISSTVSVTALTLATVFSSHLPFIFLTVFINTVIPTTMVISAIAMILIAGIHLSKNHHKQTINRFAINFEKPAPEIDEAEVAKQAPFYSTTWLLSKPRYPRADLRDNATPDDAIQDGYEATYQMSTNP